MEFKIVVDSSSNLTSDHIKDENVGFEVVPLTIRVNGKEYVDDDKVNINEMFKDLDESKVAGKTSCPSPYDFSKTFDGAKHIIVITISSKLSGCYNSAMAAKDMYEGDADIFVIDSKLVAGAMRILVDATYKLIKDGKSYDEIVKDLTAIRDNTNLLFVLDKFDNLVKNGRMNKVVAFIATMAFIRPLCYGEDGEIKVKEKIRTLKGALKRLVVNIGKMVSETKDRICVISHTCNEADAMYLKTLIKEEYEFKEIIVEENRGLCAFYSLQGGIIVSF